MEYKKVTSLVQQIVASCQQESFGLSLTKLYKILYFIDFGHYALYHQPVSNFEYLRFKFGPVPKGLHDYLTLLEEEKVIDRRKVSNPYGEHEVFELYPDVHQAEYPFSPQESETIEKTLREFKQKSATTASRETHYQSPWITTSQGEIIPYDLAKYCDFSWLGYLADDKTMEEVQEIKGTRDMLRNDEEFQDLWEQIQNL
ncbi:MAG: Panacea domain-containing protein [Bacteroidota bacterium]